MSCQAGICGLQFLNNCGGGICMMRQQFVMNINYGVVWFSCSSCHWFLAIICFPGLKGSVRFSDNTPVVVPPVTKSKKMALKKNAGKYQKNMVLAKYDQLD
jgi:hypothetical protein